MTASKGLSPGVSRCLASVVSDWSIHLTRGRPGRRLQEGWGIRPSERLTWDCRALCAGVLSCSLAMWPKTAMRRCRMMAGRPVSADISELRVNSEAYKIFFSSQALYMYIRWGYTEKLNEKKKTNEQNETYITLLCTNIIQIKIR